LVIFVAACSVGALTNFSVATFTLNAGLPWYLAGMLGMAISSVWNYGVNTIFTWRRNQQSASGKRTAFTARP
jgi:dolichol-phosphate mannosyltransferase